MIRILLTCALIATSLCAARFTTPPSVKPNPNPTVPVAAIVQFTASARVETTVTVSDGERNWDVKFDAKQDPSAGLPIVGLYPGKKHELRVQIRERGKKPVSATRTLEFTPPALPTDIAEFPPIQVKTAAPEAMEPGWTLLSVRRNRRGGGGGGGGAAAGPRGGGAPRTEPVFATGYGLVLALDEKGKVVWYYRGPNRVADVHRLRNGNVAFITNDNRLVEVDLLGNQKGCVVRRAASPRPLHRHSHRCAHDASLLRRDAQRPFPHQQRRTARNR
jgi:hypothetical protein